MTPSPIIGNRVPRAIQAPAAADMLLHDDGAVTFSVAGKTAGRRFERQPMDRQVRVTELDQAGKPIRCFKAEAVDLSRCGIGLRAGAMVHYGRTLVVEVLGTGQRVEKVLFGVVCQTRYEFGRGYAIGVEFRRRPADEDLAHAIEMVRGR